MVPTSSSPYKDTRTVTALEPIGKAESRTSGMVSKFVFLQIGGLVIAGIALFTRMRQLAHVVHYVKF